VNFWICCELAGLCIGLLDVFEVICG